VNNGFNLYQETISVTDGYNSTCCANTTRVNITVIEINNAPSFSNIGVQTVWTKGDNSTFYYPVSVSDIEYNLGYGGLTFNISIVNSSGVKHSLFNISSAGIINFTANALTPIDVYNVTICVNDTGLSSPHSKIQEYCSQTGGIHSYCDSFSLTTTNENRRPNITSYYPTNLIISTPSTQQLYFNITKHDPDGTIPDAYWYVDNILKQYNSGNLTDEFYSTFGCGVGGNHNVTVEITDGLLNYSLTWNVSVSSVSCPSPSQPPSGGAGGGGGGGAGVSGFVNFEVDPLFITTTVLQEEGKSFDIKIKNTGSKSISLSLQIQKLSDVAILSDTKIDINVGETKTVRLYLYSLSKTKPGVYFGRIVVSDGTIQKWVSIILEIKERQPLFDIKVIVPKEYKNINPGTDLRTIVEMLNVGLYGKNVDVELYLYVTDFNKLVISESSKEIIAVKTNLTIDRYLHVPFDTMSGTYLVLGEAKYNNITITTYDTFNVREKKYLKASYFFVIIFLILLILFIFFLLWKRRKKKKEQGT
jgi:hypothetical protein